MYDNNSNIIGSIIINSACEEGQGKIIVSEGQSDSLVLCISLNHKYGMTVEIELRPIAARQLIQDLERGLEEMKKNILHNERFNINIIEIDSIKPEKQGIIIVNVFKKNIIIGISLRYGGDPDITMDDHQTVELIEFLRSIG